MKLIKFILLGLVAGAFISAGFWGCAKKQLKTDEGQIKSVMPSGGSGKSPSAATGNSEKGQREVKETPPGPKVQPESVGSAKEEAALQDIHFDLDRYDIKSDAEAALQKDYSWIKANKPSLILIEGNCDERGTVEYNLALGERRAEAARKYLVALGVKEGKLKTISYGKSKPVDPGHDEEAWAKNRRDHFAVQ